MIFENTNNTMPIRRYYNASTTPIQRYADANPKLADYHVTQIQRQYKKTISKVTKPMIYYSQPKSPS